MTHRTPAPSLGGMFAWYRQRWLELVASIYLYNEHRGYTALDRVLQAGRSRWPDDHEFIAEIEQHRADEYKHYQMFKRWWQRRSAMPIAVDRTCGHIDRFVEIMFRTRINDLEDAAMVATDERFAKLCRVIALTERRGFWQVEVLLRHPAIRADRQLTKIYGIIKQDEPRHWTPYEGWLKRRGQRDPKWWERWIDSFVHSELLALKLPVLFLTPRLVRRTDWADQDDPADVPAVPTPALA
ncbi:MAG: ferritin-like domain-containing protein [Sphingomicrobium sp.]